MVYQSQIDDWLKRASSCIPKDYHVGDKTLLVLYESEVKDAGRMLTELLAENTKLKKEANKAKDNKKEEVLISLEKRTKELTALVNNSQSHQQGVSVQLNDRVKEIKGLKERMERKNKRHESLKNNIINMAVDYGHSINKDVYSPIAEQKAFQHLSNTLRNQSKMINQLECQSCRDNRNNDDI